MKSGPSGATLPAFMVQHIDIFVCPACSGKANTGPNRKPHAPNALVMLVFKNPRTELTFWNLLTSGTRRKEHGQAWALISFSVPLLGAGMLAMIMEWTDTIMLGYFTAPAQVGVYNVALRVAALCGMIHFAFGSV